MLYKFYNYRVKDVMILSDVSVVCSRLYIVYAS